MLLRSSGLDLQRGFNAADEYFISTFRTTCCHCTWECNFNWNYCMWTITWRGKYYRYCLYVCIIILFFFFSEKTLVDQRSVCMFWRNAMDSRPFMIWGNINHLFGGKLWIVPLVHFCTETRISIWALLLVHMDRNHSAPDPNWPRIRSLRSFCLHWPRTIPKLRRLNHTEA